MSMSTEDVAAIPEGDVLGGTLRSSTCPKCGQTFQRSEDRDVHLERHRAAPQLAKEERDGMVHCPKGCGRWMTPGDSDTEIHVNLCDGSKPILGEREKTAYRWWCEAHGFGTNGPKPWGQHKKEHHEGKEPVQKPKNVKPKAEAIAEVMKLLRAEEAKIEGEIVLRQMALGRVKAAMAALKGNLKTGEEA